MATSIAPGGDPHPADAEHRQEGELRRDAGHVAGHGGPLGGPDTGLPGAHGRHLDPLALALLGAGRLHHPDRAEHPLQRGAHRAHRLLGRRLAAWLIRGTTSPMTAPASAQRGHGDPQQHDVHEAHQHDGGHHREGPGATPPIEPTTW